MATQRKCRWEVYKDAQNQWRWRLRALNGRIIANGGEGYFNRDDVISAINAVCNCCTGEIVYV